MLSIVNGIDIVLATEEFIVQQCNCVSVSPHGLSKHIAKTIGVDPYSSRISLYGKNLAIVKDRPLPGTIKIYNKSNPKVICMFSQYGMGKPYTYNNSNKQWVDSFDIRKKWFLESLEQIANINPISLAFPYNIGCGQAGGNWSDNYYPMLVKFAKQHPEIKCVLYKLN